MVNPILEVSEPLADPQGRGGALGRGPGRRRKMIGQASVFSPLGWPHLAGGQRGCVGGWVITWEGLAIPCLPLHGP